MIAKVLDWFGFGPHGHGHHEPDHDHHGHTHGVVNPAITTTDRGIWAIKWSFLILATTAVLQLAVVYVSDSVALLADTIHNVADAGTAIPLWVAFVLARRKPTQTFTYGYGRVEDFAGLAIVRHRAAVLKAPSMGNDVTLPIGAALRTHASAILTQFLTQSASGDP